jgi:hypothetical protein
MNNTKTKEILITIKSIDITLDIIDTYLRTIRKLNKKQ